MEPTTSTDSNNTIIPIEFFMHESLNSYLYDAIIDSMNAVIDDPDSYRQTIVLSDEEQKLLNTSESSINGFGLQLSFIDTLAPTHAASNTLSDEDAASDTLVGFIDTGERVIYAHVDPEHLSDPTNLTDRQNTVFALATNIIGYLRVYSIMFRQVPLFLSVHDDPYTAEYSRFNPEISPEEKQAYFTNLLDYAHSSGAIPAEYCINAIRHHLEGTEKYIDRELTRAHKARQDRRTEPMYARLNNDEIDQLSDALLDTRTTTRELLDIINNSTNAEETFNILFDRVVDTSETDNNDDE